jgi:hypothetical protein
MAKGIRIFQFSLNPDVQVADFERFVREELTKTPLPSGVRMQFLKCDRDSQGDLIGTYANRLEYESVEIRDGYFPTVSETSEKFNQWWAEHGTVWEKFHSMVDGRYIDFIVYGENKGIT